MTTILVHGAWHGAWSWERVVPLLDGEVRTPTLTGLGERAAEASEAVDLETHTADVVASLGDARDVTPRRAQLRGLRRRRRGRAARGPESPGSSCSTASCRRPARR